MARVIVRNPSGAVVIDDSFVNTALKAKGAVTTANDGNGVISAVVSHTAISSSRLPILALSSNQLVYLSKVQRNGTSVSWKVATQSEGSVSYYIFDDPSSTSAAGSLVLRNAATDVVTFDSDLDYLKVVGVYVTPKGTGVATYQLPPGRVYAIVPLASSYSTQVGPAPSPPNPPPPFPPKWRIELMDASASRISGNTLTVECVTVYNRLLQGGVTNQTYYSGGDSAVMIVDVTSL